MFSCSLAIYHKTRNSCNTMLCLNLISSISKCIILMYVILKRWCISNYQKAYNMFMSYFWITAKKISKFRITSLLWGVTPVTGAFPSQMSSNAESISISWYHVQCDHIILDHLYSVQWPWHSVYFDHDKIGYHADRRLITYYTLLSMK